MNDVEPRSAHAQDGPICPSGEIVADIRCIREDGTPSTQITDEITTCDVSTGFACYAKDQKNGKKCSNYYVQYLCKKSSVMALSEAKVGEAVWTEPFIHDDPDDDMNDVEPRSAHAKDGKVCPSGQKAVDIRCVRHIDGKLSTQVHDEITTCDLELGFSCYSSKQANGKKCSNYYVQYLCDDIESPSKWTKEFRHDDPDDDMNDVEPRSAHAQDGPICPSGEIVADIRCIREDGIPSTQIADEITTCDVATGFSCYAKDQKNGKKCSNYYVQYRCEDSLKVVFSASSAGFNTAVRLLAMVGFLSAFCFTYRFFHQESKYEIIEEQLEC